MEPAKMVNHTEVSSLPLKSDSENSFEAIREQSAAERNENGADTPGSPKETPASAGRAASAPYSKRKRKPARKSSKKNVAGLTRPEPEPEPYKPYEIFPKEIVMKIAGIVPFDILAMIFNNPDYRLTKSEQASLADQWDLVIWKYAPGLLDQYGPEYLLAGSIALMVVQKSGFLSGKTENKENEENNS